MGHEYLEARVDARHVCSGVCRKVCLDALSYGRRHLLAADSVAAEDCTSHTAAGRHMRRFR